MKFLWVDMLWLLLLAPLLVAMYMWALRRKKKFTLQYSSLSLIKEAMQQQSTWKRHIPPALFLLGIVAMLFAVSRPTALVTLPTAHQTVVMAMDVSGSMRAKDVEPSRIVASQNAAKAFVNDQPKTTRIGIVTFAGTASLVQPPTKAKEDLIEAIDRFQLQRGTAVGNGLLVALKTVFPDMEIEVKGFGANAQNKPRNLNEEINKRLGASEDSAAKAPPKPVPPGSYASAVIILLTDGQTTTGADPIEAAKLAADRGVRVYTVGFGTTNGEIIGAEGWSMRVKLDEESLKQIANITHGEYFYAGSAVDLQKVYEKLNSRLVFEKKETEITAFFTAAGALLCVLAAFLSLVWFNRLM